MRGTSKFYVVYTHLHLTYRFTGGICDTNSRMASAFSVHAYSQRQRIRKGLFSVICPFASLRTTANIANDWNAAYIPKYCFPPRSAFFNGKSQNLLSLNCKSEVAVMNLLQPPRRDKSTQNVSTANRYHDFHMTLTFSKH